MRSVTYQPEPIDTSNVRLSPELRELIERLARNAHEHWTRGRLGEGWTWGPGRDDQARTHPDLVPYEELEESEKELDRVTVGETVKALLALGYRIEPPGPQGEDALPPAPDSPTAYHARAERLRAVGEPLLAYDVVQEGLERWPGDVRLRQLHGLVLADSGATERANAALAQLAAEGHQDEETTGMLARTHKDLWGRACGEEEKASRLRLARQTYERAYRTSGGYWTGINAATLAALQGDPSAASLAAEVHDQCLAELRRVEREGAEGYWLLATLGEACLVMGHWSEAEDWYKKAADSGRGRGGDLSSTRRNARLLLGLPGVGERVRRRVEACFRVPPIVMFTGHMIDRPDRSGGRFPPELGPAVAAAIRQRLHALGAPVAFASAACGSDLLFLETVLDLGGEANVVLPYDVEPFVRDSVQPGGADWLARFHRVLNGAARVVVASERCGTPSPHVYNYCNLLLRGLATIRARQFDGDLRAIAVWDRRPGEGPGGTAATVGEWQSAGVPVEVIDLRRLGESRGLAPPKLARSRGRVGFSEPDPDPVGVKAMLFADAAGFSRLSEEQVPVFVEQFLGAVGALCAQASEPPVTRNTWGDGLFFVFDSPAAAGSLALDLCESLAAADWGSLGLAPDLSLRIGLHAGPVYQHIDPVTGLLNYSGTHVNRAARIEPITPPGQVYASESFAALCAAWEVDDLVFDYVGQTPLAKGYGTFRTYHVRRRAC